MKRIKFFPQLWWILGLLIACILVLWPLFKGGFFVSDDGEWMIIRLSAFFQSFREGQFPVRFLGRLNHSYGYPVANFLYPGFLYLGSLIHVLGFSFPDTIKIILIASVLVAAFFTYFWLKTSFGSLASFTGVLGFLFAPYLTFDMYKRGSVGEILALAAGAAGFYSLDRGKRWLFPLVIGFLIISHNSLALLLLVMFAGYIWVRQLHSFWPPLIIGLGLATFFWFPALFERRYVIFDVVTVSRPTEYFVEGNSLSLLGIVGVITLILILFKQRVLKSSSWWYFWLVSLLSFFLATAVSAPVWKIGSMVKLLQFPYRTLALSLFSTSWLIAALMEHTSKFYQWKLWILFLILWLVPLTGATAKVQIVTRPEGYYTTNEATTTVADEYMPRWVTRQIKERRNQKLEFLKGNGEINYQKISSQRVEAIINTKIESILQLNTIYYPGWGVVIDDNPVHVDYLTSEGLILVKIPPGRHRLVAEFHETLPRFIADLTSASFGLVYVGYLLSLRRTKVKDK